MEDDILNNHRIFMVYLEMEGCFGGYFYTSVAKHEIIETFELFFS